MACDTLGSNTLAAVFWGTVQRVRYQMTVPLNLTTSECYATLLLKFLSPPLISWHKRNANNSHKIYCLFFFFFFLKQLHGIYKIQLLVAQLL